MSETKRTAVSHDGTTYYAPLIDTTATNASALRIVDDGDVYSVPIIPCYRLYYANGTVETASAGTALDLNDYSGVIKVLSNSNGTITANSAGTAIGGKNVSLIGGVGNDVFIHYKGNNTIANYVAGDIISLSSYNATDIIAVKVDSVNGGATLGFDEGDSLVLEGVTSETPITIKSVADTRGTRYFFANNSIKSSNSSENLYVSNIDKCLTYNDYSRQVVTLNGSAEAVNGKKKFIADSLLAGEYASSVVTIVASDSMVRDNIYIKGNDQPNYIYSNANGNSLDGGAYNDELYSGAGADTFVYRKGNGNDIIYQFKNGKDAIMLLSADGESLKADDYTTTFDGNEIIFYVNDYTDNYLKIDDPFTYNNNATSITTSVNGAVYTYFRNGTIYSNNRATLNGATEYAVTSTNKANGVTITDYSDATNITGLNFNDIKNCSYSGSTITLGLESSNVILQEVETNALKLNGTTVYVDTNMIFNAADSLSVTLVGATAYAVTNTDKTNGVTITNYNAGVNLTNLAFDEIKNCSYSSGTITLGLESSNVILQEVETNALKLNGTTVYVDTNMIFNAADSLSATSFLLTADNTAGIDIAGTSTAVKVDASRTQGGITLISGAGNDTLIGSSGSDSLTGNAGADLFVYNGGHDVIVDYSAADGDKISVARDGMLDFADVTFGGASGTNITLNGTTGNSLAVKGGAGQLITVLSAKGTSREISYSYRPDITDGILNAAENYLLLKNRTTDFEPTADVYPNLVTIDAAFVFNTGVGIHGINSVASCLIAGDSGLSLFGGMKGDTLIGGDGDDTLTGGAGADVFVHTGGRTTITDYSIADKDKVSLANCNMGDISGISVGSDNNISLEFGNNGSIVLQNVSSSDKVTFASATDTFGTGYIFDNGSVRTGLGYGVTLTAKDAEHTITGVQETVIANNGGTLEGGSQKATLGGAGNISISGGTGAEIFVYKGGGNMSIANYASSDTISLASGYSVKSKSYQMLVTVGAGDDTQENVVLSVSGGNATQTITIENSTALNSVKVNTNGTVKTINLPHGEITFNNSDPAGATEVVLRTDKLVDFGVFSKGETVPSTATGSEYYTALNYIFTMTDNTRIVGNAKANYVTLSGGSDNYLVDGIGAGNIFFDKGGGLIADWGIGATQLQLDGKKKYLATTTKRTGTTTYVGYNRTNTGSYARGADHLTLNGTVKAIYYDTISTNSASINTFDVAIVYTDTSSKDEVILLPDIAKQRTGTATSSLHAASFNRAVIYDNAHADSLTADDKATLVHDWADFPASLQAQTIKLYNMYNSGNFKNGYASLSPVPQALPDWVPDKEWLS